MLNEECPQSSNLCYLPASKVESPAGVLSELHLLSADGESLGSIAGVVIEAAAKRVRYLDVKTAGWLKRRRYLVEVDQLAQVELEQKVLRLRADSQLREVCDLDRTALRQYSDEDLLAALFPTRAA